MVAEATLLSNPILEHLIGGECMTPEPMTSDLKIIISLRKNSNVSFTFIRNVGGTWSGWYF